MPVERTSNARGQRRGGAHRGVASPLVLPVLGVAAGIALAEYAAAGVGLNPWVAWILVSLLLAAAMASGRNRDGARWSGLLLLTAALGVGYVRQRSAVDLPSDHIGRLVFDEPVLARISGVVVTTPRVRPAEARNPFLPFAPLPRTTFLLKSRTLHGAHAESEIRGIVRCTIKSDATGIALGDEVDITGWLYRPIGARNPGEPDRRAWNRYQGVYAGLSSPGGSLVQCERAAGVDVRRVSRVVRDWCRALLFEPQADASPDDRRDLLNAMVLGQRSAPSAALNETFLRIGAIHFLTVSGFHVGVLMGTVWVVVCLVLRRSARVAALATLGVLAIYLVLVEPNAPILRAATIGVLGCVAILLGRDVFSLNWLALAALMLLANPMMLFRAGFQLSFVQVVALITVVAPLYRRLVIGTRSDQRPSEADTWGGFAGRSVFRFLAGLLIVSCVAWVVSLPLVVYHFQRFAPWAAVQSFLVSPLVIATIGLAFLKLLAAAILPPLGAVLGVALGWITGLLLALAEWLSRWPHSLIECRPPPGVLVLASYVCFGLFLWSCRRSTPEFTPARPERRVRFGVRAATATIALSLALAWTAWLFIPRDSQSQTELHVLSVGNGSAALLTTPNGHGAFFDLGTIQNFDAGETAVRAARALGVRSLDLVSVSHANFDHFSGLPTLLQKMAVERFATNPYFGASVARGSSTARLVTLLPPSAPQVESLVAGDSVRIDPVTIDVLWPPADLPASWSANDRSLVLRVTCGKATIMVPGDAAREALRRLVEAHELGSIDLRCDVLIAPHHGSVVGEESVAFYRAVNPSTIIVSTGDERPALLAMIRRELGASPRVLLTRDVGDVRLRIGRGGVEIDTPFHHD